MFSGQGEFAKYSIRTNMFFLFSQRNTDFFTKGNFAKGNFYECEPQNYNTRMPWGASIVRIIYVKQNIYKLNTMRRGSGEPSQPVMTFRGARKYLSKRYLSIILSIISSGDHTKAKESCHRERTES